MLEKTPDAGSIENLSPEGRRRHEAVLALRDFWEQVRKDEGGLPEPGLMEAWLAGGKPAVTLERAMRRPGNLDALKDIAAEAGIEAESVGDILYDPARVLERVAAEPELAAEAGWDDALGLKENVGKASLSGYDSPEAQAMTGFVLGFPASAIRGYRQLEELGRRGMPFLPDLYRAKELMSLSDDAMASRGRRSPARRAELEQGIREKLRAASYDPEIQTAVAALDEEKFKREEESGAAYLQGMTQVERNRVYDEIWRRHRDAVRDEAVFLLTKVFGATPDEAEFVASQGGCFIPGLEGRAAYYFTVFDYPGYGGSEADDVKALRREVREAFKRAGFETEPRVSPKDIRI